MAKINALDKEINNPDFNSPEFEGIINQAGLNLTLNLNLENALKVSLTDAMINN
jgi:hypothetical protein